MRSFRMTSCAICRASLNSCEDTQQRITLHRFPLARPHVLKKWTKFSHLSEEDDLKNLRLCSRHFKAEDITQHSFRTLLARQAIPCLFPPESSTHAEETEVKDTNSSKLEVSDFDEHETEDDWKDEAHFSDPAFLDHDYFGTLKPCEQQKNGDPKENGENQLVLQDIRKELCRLCGRKGPLLMPIFNTTSCALNGEVTISDKIEMYLPFKVKMEDPLPSHICIRCSELLSRWHELYLTCVAADAVLWKTFGGESDVSSRKDKDHSSNRNQEIDAQCADNAKKLEDDMENGEALNEAYEEPEVLCSVCGMNTPSKPPKEEDPLIEEFEKFYSEVRSVKYKCRYCSEFFLSSRAKKEHIINCRELSTLCECCGKNGICRKDLQKHKYIKHQQVIVERTCDRCGKCFKSLALFKRHYFLVHVQGLEKKFCCSSCCTAYADEQIYRSHVKRHERGELKAVFQIEEYLDGGVYVCPVCKEIFNDILSLVVHLTSKKEIKCPSCFKRMPSEKKFMLHVCKEWHCRYCSKSYKRKIQCVIHERLHTGEKPIKCRTCDKRFHSFQLRTRHETTHAPSFECTICNKKFKNKYVFQDHLQWHDGKVFLCSICGKGFCARKNVKKHARLFHKGVNVEITVSNL